MTLKSLYKVNTVNDCSSNISSQRYIYEQPCPDPKKYTPFSSNKTIANTETLKLPTIPTDDEGNTKTRSLGLVVARGTLLVVISPLDGSEQIENPFLQQQEDDD